MRYYYVSVIDGADYRFLAGPYDTHEEAESKVDVARQLAIEYDPKALGKSYVLQAGLAFWGTRQESFRARPVNRPPASLLMIALLRTGFLGLSP